MSKDIRDSYLRIHTIVHQTVLFFPLHVVHPGEFGESPVHNRKSRAQVNNNSRTKYYESNPYPTGAFMFQWACACLLGHAAWKYTYISFIMYTHTQFNKDTVWLVQSKIDHNSVRVLGLNPKWMCPKRHTCSTYPDKLLSVQSHDQSVRSNPCSDGHAYGH